ncbi:acyl-homoserine-lactone synthase [uncultured Roseovarius sp.]|uniref:acyl-homoserine-lactone synthase n=1 Tax=uncultured Roseovarius sp. TaxID=293344 RepID=UPI00262E3BDC|nr:acyl-homoserine-lactone synthase [uncultured Roseovarius sp.]
MIKFLSGNEINSYPKLQRTMYTDRAIQFSKRLRWEVTVDENGEERDEYDALNPFYVILEDFNGAHAGSLRFLPTTGKTMVNDHFTHLTDGIKIQSPHIWECTRFCVSPNSDRRAAAKLLAAGAFLMHECCIDHFVGVFDDRMERIYKTIGANPTVLGRQQVEKGTIGIGLWEFNDEQFQQLLTRARLTRQELDWSFHASSFPFALLSTPVYNTPGSPSQCDLSFAY